MLATPLRIAMLGPARFGVGEPFAGGLEAHTVTTARALIALGHQVTVFAGPVGAAAPPDLEVVPVIDGIDDLRRCERLDLAMSPDAVLDARRGYAKRLDEIAHTDSFDVVHNNSLHAAPVDLDGEFRTPMVHFLHCPPFEELAEAHRRRSDRVVDPTAGVVAVSRTLARQWIDIAGHSIWNGIDTRSWRPRRRDDRIERCAWAGRIVSEKAPHLAIDAARRAGRPIAIAGPIQEPRYFERAIVPRLGPDATYLGHLDTAHLASLFSSSSVGVVTPRWDEPFGLVVAEMLACGTPVAAFARGALNDIVSPVVGTLCRPDDVDALAHAIVCASRLSRRACRTYATAHFSVGRMAEAYVQRYRRSIGGALHAVAG